MKPIFKWKLVTLAANTLRIHPEAQRQLVPAKLKKLMGDFDLDAVGVLHAVEYSINGVFGVWVVDGQHRIRALIEHGFGEWLVKVAIHTDVTDDAAASRLFLLLNDRAPVSPFDKFQNEVRALVPDAVGAERAMRERGFKPARACSDGTIAAVTALKKLHAADAGKSLALTLDTILAAWGKRSSAVEGKLIEGLGLCFRTYNGSIDQQVMVKKLAKYPGGASGLLGDAKGMTRLRKVSLARSVAERIVEIYNSGMRSGRLDPL